jgi:polyhydroxyalkanoate synthesis regulator phasin
VNNRGFFDRLEEGYAWKVNILLKTIMISMGGKMMSSIRKLLLASLGLVDLTKEKAEQVVADLVERGEMTSQEGEDFLAELFQRVDTEKDQMLHRIQKESRKLMYGMGVASKEEVQELRLRVDRLEDRLKSMEAKPEIDSAESSMEQ